MRYDTKALFRLVEDTYDSNGDYTETIVEEHTEYCAVQETDVQTMHIVYGEIKQGSITISLQNYIGYVFNRIHINGVDYTVDQAFTLRTKKVYIASQCH